MRFRVMALAVGLLLVTGIASRQAQAQAPPSNRGRSMGNLHPDSYTAGRAIRGSNRGPSITLENHGRSMGNLRPDSYTAGRAIQGSNRAIRPKSTRRAMPTPYYYRPYPGGYGYYPYYAAPAPYYYYPGYVYPPVVLPPGMFYGPGVPRRLMVW